MAAPEFPKKKKAVLLARPIWVDVAFPSPPPEMINVAGLIYSDPQQVNPTQRSHIGYTLVYRYTIQTTTKHELAHTTQQGRTIMPTPLPSEIWTGASKSSSRGDRVPPIVVAEIAPRTPKLRNSYSTNIVEDFVNGISNFFTGK